MDIIPLTRLRDFDDILGRNGKDVKGYLKRKKHILKKICFFQREGRVRVILRDYQPPSSAKTGST
jgi:hypothetical protein